MEGKAFSFYSTKVAHNPRKWDLKSFFIGLFDYYFPNNFIEEQRNKFENMYQKNNTAEEFLRKLELIRGSIGNISDRELVRQFWKGANQQLQSKWLDLGYIVKRATVDKLKEAAKHFKKARDNINKLRNSN